jgi:uncharacterized phosphosugar-binding protein
VTPGIDGLDPAALDVADVAGGDGGAMGAGDGGDLSIELADRASRGSALRADAGVLLGGGAVKGQDAVAESSRSIPFTASDSSLQRLPFAMVATP